jgi:hypothetical protein
VLYYQLAIADLGKPLAEGWRADVGDDILRDDIARCVGRDPAGRPTAAELAVLLRTVEPRRAEKAAQARALAAAARRTRRRRLARLALTAAGGLFALSAVAVTVYVRDVNAEKARTTAALTEVTGQKAKVEDRRNRAVAEKGNADAVLAFLDYEVLANATPEKIHDVNVRDQIVAATIALAAARVGGQAADRGLGAARDRHDPPQNRPGRPGATADRAGPGTP